MAEDKIAVYKTNSLSKLYQEFGKSTSMHGISRVITNTRMCRRVVWSVLVLFGLGFATYQIVTTLTDFYSYPVTTVVTLKSEKKTTFPGITICNLNRKRKSMISLDLLTEISAFKEIEVSPEDTVLNVLMQNEYLNSDVEPEHQISDMLIKCVFNRMRCSQANFSRMETATYGTCYTFEITDPQLEYATRAGPQNGLILELNIEQYEYLSISSKAGVKVIVHPADEYIFPEDGGILAQPGTATSIGIKKIITHRLPAPYSTCVGAKGQGSLQRSLFPEEKYTQQTCMKSCYQLTLYEECECCDVDVPCDYYTILNIDKPKAKTARYLSFCNTTENLECELFVEDQFMKSELDCDERCPLACDRTTFDTVISTALWPSDFSFEAFLETVNDTVLQNQSFTDNTSLERFIRSNFLRLEIFLDSLEFLEFTTQAKYDWNSLLGTIGGLMGLWLGFSLLTALEVAELLLDTVLYCIRRKSTKKMTIQTEKN